MESNGDPSDNLARVSAGWKGGGMIFTSPISPVPEKTIVRGHPAEAIPPMFKEPEKLPIIDPWGSRK